MGSGKSTTAREFESTARYIHADILLQDAARRAFPFIKKSRQFSWSAWPRDKSTMHIHTVLHLSLETVSQDLRHYSGNLIIEGSILATDWFRRPLQEVLPNFNQDFPDSVVKHFHLNPPPATVIEHIQRRAKEKENRRHEAETFPDVESVARHNERYCSRFTKDIWTVCESNEELDSSLKKFFQTTKML